MKNLITFLLFFFLKTIAFSQDFDKLIEEGDVFYNKKNYEKAAEIFTKAIAVAPKNSKGYWYRGDAYFYSGNYPKAIADYTKAIEIEPENWKFYKIRGESYALLKENALACADYQQAFALGDQASRNEAKSIGCDWAQSQEVPCPQGEMAVSRVDVDAFTGAVFVSKGLSYSKTEFKPEKGMGVITGPRIGQDDSFVVKLLEPHGFCADGDDNVYFGLGFSLFDENKTELANVADLYAEKDEALPAEFLKSLSATLGFTQLEKNKNYLLKVRFFDKRGRGEILMEMPFTNVLKTDIFNNTSTTVNTLGMGINSAAVGTEVKAISFKNLTSQSDINRFELQQNQPTALTFSGIKKIGKNAQYILRIINPNGEIIHNETGKAAFKSGSLDINLPSEKFSKGNYTIWVKLFDATKNTIGVVIPASAQ